MRERRSTIPGPEGPIPTLFMENGKTEGLPAVILCHGLGVHKGTNRPELGRLAAAGFLAVGLDAPSHGARLDDRQTRMDGLPHPERYSAFMDLVSRAAREIPSVVRFLLEQGSPSVGLIGISMGGFTGFAACLLEPRPSSMVCLLASPDFRYRVGPERTPEPGYDDSPHRFPERFPPTALKIVTAGRDTTVPPAPSRAFAETLRPFYRTFPERLSAREFPESEHLMRPEDWDAAWDDSLDWFSRHLPRTS